MRVGHQWLDVALHHNHHAPQPLPSIILLFPRLRQTNVSLTVTRYPENGFKKVGVGSRAAKKNKKHRDDVGTSIAGILKTYIFLNYSKMLKVEMKH